MLGVLFDLDKTLVDRDSMHRAYCRELIGRHASDESPLEHEARLQAMIAADKQIPHRGEYFQWVSRQFTDIASTGDALWQEYRERVPRSIRAFPGAMDVVTHVAQRYRVGVVTNGSSAVQRTKLLVTGLAELFKIVAVSGEVGSDKPDAAIFLQALAGIGLKPEQTLFVGDDPRCDVAGAAAVGMRTCWISWGKTYPAEMTQPDCQIEHIGQLPSVLP